MLYHEKISHRLIIRPEAEMLRGRRGNSCSAINLVSQGFGQDIARRALKNDIDRAHSVEKLVLAEANLVSTFAPACSDMIEYLKLS